jgi:hypothetical protein
MTHRSLKSRDIDNLHEVNFYLSTADSTRSWRSLIAVARTNPLLTVMSLSHSCRVDHTSCASCRPPSPSLFILPINFMEKSSAYIPQAVTVLITLCSLAGGVVISAQKHKALNLFMSGFSLTRHVS